MTSPAPLKCHKIVTWTAENIQFQRVDISTNDTLEFNKVFHDEIVMLAFTHSTWRSRQNGKTYLETPDDVIIRDAGQIYSSRLEQAHELARPVCREIHLSRDKLASLYESAENTLPAVDFSSPVVQSQDIKDLFVKTHEVFENHECALRASTHLTWLIGKIAQATSGQALRISKAACKKRSHQIVDFLRSNFHQKVTLDDLSRLCEVNPYVLLRQFKVEFGITPHDYLLAYRVYKAKQFIQAGHAFAEVALMCGFSDQSHLNRRFKQRLGVSPGSISAR